MADSARIVTKLDNTAPFSLLHKLEIFTTFSDIHYNLLVGLVRASNLLHHIIEMPCAVTFTDFFDHDLFLLNLDTFDRDTWRGLLHCNHLLDLPARELTFTTLRVKW